MVVCDTSCPKDCVNLKIQPQNKVYADSHTSKKHGVCVCVHVCGVRACMHACMRVCVCVCECLRVPPDGISTSRVTPCSISSEGFPDNESCDAQHSPMRKRENEPGHFNYACVMYLFVMPSVL